MYTISSCGSETYGLLKMGESDWSKCLRMWPVLEITVMKLLAPVLQLLCSEALLRAYSSRRSRIRNYNRTGILGGQAIILEHAVYDFFLFGGTQELRPCTRTRMAAVSSSRTGA